MNVKKGRQKRNLQRREAREHLGLSTADDPPQHYSTLLTTPPLSGSPFSFVFHLLFPGVPGGRGFWVGPLGVWPCLPPPPPLVAMGRVISMPGAPQGVFVFWVRGFFVFLSFSLHSTPTRWPLSHSWAMCLYTVIWLFLSVSFSVSFWFSFWSLSLL